MKLLPEVRSKRRPLDFYETPEYYVQVLKRAVPIRPTASIIEPCVGDGAIARFFPEAHTNDIDPKREADYHFDASEPWPFSQEFEWGITNPPFNKALPILLELIDRCKHVAAILRISFLEPTKDRVDFLVNHPPSSLIYLPRYSFKGNGHSDMATVMWAFWNVTLDPPIQIAERFPDGKKA